MRFIIFNVTIWILLLFAIPQNCKSQGLGSTKIELANKYGYNYSSGTTEDGLYQYISYESHSGIYTSYTSYYFNSEQVCVFYRIIEQNVGTNEFIKILNRDYVKVGDLKWKDYKSNVLYSVDIQPYWFSTTITYDINHTY